jgi:tetratricopeptide (TPR) repeat protein
MWTYLGSSLHLVGGVLLLLAGGLGPGMALIQAPDGVTSLRLADVIQRKIAGGQTHYYKVALETDQYVRVAMESSAGRKHLVSIAPNGRQLFEAHLGEHIGAGRVNFVGIVAETAGEYRLEVRAPGAKEAEEYTLRVEEMRPATEGDRNRFDAEQRYDEAMNLIAKKGTENYRQALGPLHRSLELWRKLRDVRWEGTLLTEIGGVHRMLAENQTAIEYYQLALPLHRLAGNPREEAGTLNNIAAVLLSRGENPKAIEYMRQSLDVARTNNDSQAQAILLNNIGALHESQGDLQMALDYLTRALPLRQKVGDRQGQVRTLNSLAKVYAALGETANAQRLAEQALAIAEEIQDPQLQAVSLNSLGVLGQRLGNRTWR